MKAYNTKLRVAANNTLDILFFKWHTTPNKEHHFSVAAWTTLSSSCQALICTSTCDESVCSVWIYGASLSLKNQMLSVRPRISLAVWKAWLIPIMLSKAFPNVHQTCLKCKVSADCWLIEPSCWPLRLHCTFTDSPVQLPVSHSPADCRSPVKAYNTRLTVTPSNRLDILVCKRHNSQ